MSVCYVCARRPAESATVPCPECQHRMLAGIFVIPVSDDKYVRVPGVSPLFYSEQTIRDAFKGTPALDKMLAARAVRMEMTVIVASGLSLA